MKFDSLVKILHKNGLSDIALHLEVYIRLATQFQLNTLESSIRYWVEVETK